jgi:putative endonuclease
MHYVYALQSLVNKNWLYVGVTDDLRQRLDEHSRGKVYSTSRYLPLRLVYYEAYLSKGDAVKRECQLKHNSQQKEQLKFRLVNSLV